MRWTAKAALVLTGAAVAAAALSVPSQADDRERPVQLTPARAVSSPTSGQIQSGPNDPQRVSPLYGTRGGVIEVERIRGPRGTGSAAYGSQGQGFGAGAWDDTPEEIAEALIRALPVGAPSPVMGKLIRSLLETPGPARAAQPMTQVSQAPSPNALWQPRPAWQTDTESSEFLGMRLSRLLAAGHLETVSELAARASGPQTDPALSRVEAESHLLDGDDTEACDLAMRMRLETAEPFWVKLRAYCYFLQDAPSAARLMADLLGERGVDAPLFFALVDRLGGGDPVPSGAWRTVDPLTYAMASRAGDPIPAEALDGADPAVLRVLAMDQTPLFGEDDQARLLKAGERSVASGALEPAALARLYGAMAFPSEAFEAPLRYAETLPAPKANALFYQLVEAAGTPAMRVELLSEALRAARASQSYLPVAMVHGERIVQTMPAPDLWWAAADMGAASLIAERPDQASRWREVLQIRIRGGGTPEDVEHLRRLSLLMAVAAPPMPATRRPHLALDAWIRMASAGQIADQGLHRELLILDALAMPLPASADLWLINREIGARPTSRTGKASILARLDRAAARNRIGETIALALIATGKAGPRDADPLLVTSAIRALAKIGLTSDSQRLAFEAVLMSDS